MNSRIAAISFALAACSGDATPSQAEPVAVPALAPVQLVDQPVGLVLTRFAELLQLPLVVEPHAQELATCARVTVVAPAAAVDSTLSVLASSLEPLGLHLERSETGLFVRREPGASLPESCRSLRTRRPVPTRAGPGAAEVRRSGENTYAVLKSYRQRSANLEHVRAVPNLENGRIAGIRLYSIRPASFLRALHFQNGDRVIAVNGSELAGEIEPLAAALSADGPDSVSVVLKRRGQTVELTFRFVDELPPQRGSRSEVLNPWE